MEVLHLESLFSRLDLLSQKTEEKLYPFPVSLSLVYFPLGFSLNLYNT